MKFELTHPCGECPFRSDVLPFLRVEKVIEVLGNPDGRGAAAFPGTGFICHKTINYGARTKVQKYRKAQHCAGAAIVLVHDDMPNDTMQLAERLLGWQPSSLDMKAPVYPSRAACIEAHR